MNLPPATLQTTRINLEEPMSQLSYAYDQQISPQEPQDVEMTTVGDSQEMYFGEIQTDDGDSQTGEAPGLIYKNNILDVTSLWAQRWRRHDIEGGEVFYQPEVSLIMVLNRSDVY